MTAEETAKNKLLNCYADIIEKLKHEVPGGATNPLLVDIPDGYFGSQKTRVMIFGQETNDWHGEFKQEIDYSEFVKKYHRFFIDKKSKYSNSGIFMQFLNSLEEDIKGEASVVWNNVVKIGKAKGAGLPSANILEWQKNLNKFIEQEIEILKPQDIIFLTGPSYDKFLPSKPSNIEKYTNEFKPRQIGKLECCGVPALRTYHPKYLRLSGNEKRYKELILSFIKNPK